MVSLREGKNLLVVKIVNEELIATLGEPARLNLSGPSPHVIMLVGLQGSGKTTSVAKLSRLLKEREKINIRPTYVKTHTNVYRHVVTGRAAAGGGVRRTLEREPEGLREQLQILYETPKSYPHPIVIHPRVPAATRERVQQALLDLGSDPETAGLLKRVQIPNPTATAIEDYQVLQVEICHFNFGVHQCRTNAVNIVNAHSCLFLKN